MSIYDTPLTMQFAAGLSALAFMTVVLMIGGALRIPVVSPSFIGARELVLLLLMGVFGTSGHLLFVQGGKLVPSSLVAPMQYIEIVCAAVLGYVVFSEFPSLWKWIGIAIVVGSGAYVFWRESRLR
jgi:drug/metabolite transporter (DMT)-like permease